MKFAGAVVDLFTLGQAMVLAKGAGLGATAVVKTIGLELLSNASAYTVGYAGDAMGAPLPATWFLSVVAGGSVSWAGGKYIYKDVNGGGSNTINPQLINSQSELSKKYFDTLQSNGTLKSGGVQEEQCLKLHQLIVIILRREVM